MATNFPTSLDALTNPASTDTVAAVDHAAQHANANDAIEALEAKVGINSSAVTTSHDYKLSEVTTTDKAVGKTATQTLTNKTLTTPVIGDFTNATHTHGDAAGGGTLNASAIAAGTLPLARGGTGASLVDPNADRIVFWDDSAGSTAFLEVGTGLSITGTTLSASGNTPTMTAHIAAPDFHSGMSNITINSNTTGYTSSFTLPAQITVNKLSVACTTATTAGTIKIGIYSEDGQTKHIDITTASISATGIVTTAVSAVTLSAGRYYAVIVPVSTTNINLRSAAMADEIITNGVTSEPDLMGTQTVTAGTLPTTFTTSSLTSNTNAALIRFDN